MSGSNNNRLLKCLGCGDYIKQGPVVQIETRHKTTGYLHQECKRICDVQFPVLQERLRLRADEPIDDARDILVMRVLLFTHNGEIPERFKYADEKGAA